MSFHTYHTYGYGVELTNVTCDSPDRLKLLLSVAPEFQKQVNEWFEQNEIEEPTVDDYLELEESYNLGYAYILQQVILEAEGIEFTPCDDFDDRIYLLYEPFYPWDMPDKDKSLKERDIACILVRYLTFLTSEEIPVDYYSPENGG